MDYKKAKYLYFKEKLSIKRDTVSDDFNCMRYDKTERNWLMFLNGFALSGHRELERTGTLAHIVAMFHKPDKKTQTY